MLYSFPSTKFAGLLLQFSIFEFPCIYKTLLIRYSGGMSWQNLEKMFNRAASDCFAKRKGILVFCVLALCGLISVICRGVSLGATQWMQMSLTFLPIFLCSGILLALGVVLTRLYHAQVKGETLGIFKTIAESKELFWGIPYLTVPLIFSYLVLWIVLGVFYLLREIPHIGPSLGSIFSFGPFLLVFGSIVLGVLSLLTLFFVSPAAAFGGDLKPKLAERVFAKVRENPFSSGMLLLIGLLPLLLLGGVLGLAALMTHLLYVEGGSSFVIVMRWFFMMLPFCALLTPTILFFFNFATEAHVLMVKMEAVEQ